MERHSYACQLCLDSSVVYAASGCTVLSLLFWERDKAELHIERDAV